MASDELRIDRVDVLPFTIALDGIATRSGGRMDRRAGWLVRIVSAGHQGWGEASPLPGFSAETSEDARVALERAADSLPGTAASLHDPLAWLADRLDDTKIPQSARFALELAAVNLAAAVRGRTAASILRHNAGDGCEVAALLAGDTAACVTAAERARRRGFRAVKLKVGDASAVDDAARVRAVAGRLEGAVALRLDANRAWPLDTALRFVDAVGDLRPEYIEEPLDDPESMPTFAAETGWPVALDESLRDGRAPIAFEGLVAVVLKPTLMGGLLTSLETAGRFAANGVDAVVSSTFESGVGLHGLVALAASLPGAGRPAGLGTAVHARKDTIDPRFPADAPAVPATVSYRVRIPGAS